jgi:hypothetical protein
MNATHFDETCRNTRKMATLARRLKLWFDHMSVGQKECYSSRTYCVMLRAAWMVTETVGMSCEQDWISAFVTKAEVIIRSKRPQPFTGIGILLHLMTKALRNRPGKRLLNQRLVFYRRHINSLRYSAFQNVVDIKFITKTGRCWHHIAIRDGILRNYVDPQTALSMEGTGHCKEIGKFDMFYVALFFPTFRSRRIADFVQLLWFRSNSTLADIWKQKSLFSNNKFQSLKILCFWYIWF